MESTESVRVAVNIRPLITQELLDGCTDCITVLPKEPQVHIGSHTFTYDFVFGNAGFPCLEIYDHCVAPLVDALFKGYNATLLAYGQTGSGKTYTMGTNYSGDGKNGGIIPKVMEDIFKRVELAKDSTKLLIQVSFIEIFKEEVFDLLHSNSSALLKNDAAVQAKHTALSRAPIQIRETASGGITLAGVTEAEVNTKEEMGAYLARGSLSRATGRANMNSQSSRSHAIFTITLEQKKLSSCSSTTTEDAGDDDILCAKLHLVDLAGSERAKRTGADGMRLKEGIHINKGLLALGNVISALGDERRRKRGHVPYRDSKLTRLLQDSLGGNSKTVMIACVSPADTNAEETLNTLKYANRARNIQNKAVINRDSAAAQMQRMQSQIEQLQTELLVCRGDSGAFDELQHKVSLLEASNHELQNELQRRVACEHFSKRAYDAQVEKDKLIMTIESVRNGKFLDEIESYQDEDVGLINKYVPIIQELEGERLHIKSFEKSSNCQYSETTDTYEDGPSSSNVLFPSSNEPSDCEDKVLNVTDEIEFQEKDFEHCSLQEKLDMELNELDKRLEEKEAEMKRYSSGDASVLKQHYEEKVHELEQEKKQCRMLTKTNLDLGFPRRLYSLGCEPERAKSLNYYCKTDFLNKVEEAVGEVVWNHICNTDLGVIARFVTNKFEWSAKVVEKVLEKRLVCNKKYEIWCLFGSKPARFSLSEFESITSLNCAPLPDENEEEIDVEKGVHEDLWTKLKLRKSENPSMLDLMNVVEDVAKWKCDEDKIRYAYLSILVTVIKGHDIKTKLRKRARMVFDLPKFEGYPWGRLAFKTLIKSVKMAKLEEAVTIHGFVQVLQIWVYNLFPKLGQQFGNPLVTECPPPQKCPPLLKFKGKKWYGKRDIDKFLVGDEINIDNAFIKSEPTIWDDDSEDKEIEALVQAICKEGGLGAVTWVEQGLKSFNKERSNTAGLICVDGGGEVVHSGQTTAGRDCGGGNRGEKKMTKMTKEEFLKNISRDNGGKKRKRTEDDWCHYYMRMMIGSYRT